jgi:hypothetical protein
MQATDSGYLKNRSAMTRSPDGSTASFRSGTLVDPHQVRALSVESVSPAFNVVIAVFWTVPLHRGSA